MIFLKAKGDPGRELSHAKAMPDAIQAKAAMPRKTRVMSRERPRPRKKSRLRRKGVERPCMKRPRA